MSGNKTNNRNKLVDKFGRVHNYLRLSLTDQCNFACTYCMPDNKQCELSGGKMLAHEIIELAKAFKHFGVQKIRLTGGEPTVHKDFEQIITELGKLNIEIGITTNGFLLDKYFNILHANGVKKLNISLDTLQSSKFKTITQQNAFDRVFANLIMAMNFGFEVKLNAVIMRDTNHNEINDFARLTQKYPLIVRFIEFMPFKDNNWNFGKTFSEKEIIDTLSAEFNLVKEDSLPQQTANYYKIAGALGKVGIISTLSHPFCDSCNRIRVMADGKLKNCLFGEKEYDLITPFRNGEPLKEVIQYALGQKHEFHGGNKSILKPSPDVSDNRNMYSIGG